MAWSCSATSRCRSGAAPRPARWPDGDAVGDAAPTLAALDDAFHAFLSFLGTQAFNVVRAAAIAIFIVFLVLAFLAASKGLRAGWALVIGQPWPLWLNRRCLSLT